MGILAILFYALGFLCSIGSLVYFVMILIQMFKHEQTGIAIATIIGLFCGYAGPLALIYGWMKATEWNMKKTMVGYTATFVVSIVFMMCGIGFGMMAAGNAVNDMNKEFNKQLQMEVEKNKNKNKAR